jgi:hypothetical protein
MTTQGIDALIQQVSGQSNIAADILLEARTLDQIKADPAWIATNNLLGNRFLCRGGSMLMLGPTGIGKSVLSMQQMILWAIGRACFGIKPQKALRILLVQAENDDGDLAQMRDGIFDGLGLTAEERALACQNIHIVSVSTKTGAGFIEWLRKLVEKYKPDLVWIDPFFAFLGDAATDQKAVSWFLRNGLNSILQEFRCGAVVVHHTNKPYRGVEKADHKAGDLAYLGSGSAEIANWPRAIIAIRSIGSHSVFAVVLGKRGSRAGIFDAAGDPVYSFYIQHGKDGIYWTPATKEDAKIEPDKKSQLPKPTEEDLLSLIPENADISAPMLEEAATSRGFSARAVDRSLKVLVEKGKVFVWLTPRPRTHSKKTYSRKPQSENQP